MLGKSVLTRASSSSADNRTFVYEVAGLRPNEQMNNNSYPLRKSENIFIQVPYSRMNDEMRRISRLGGRIVNISTHAAGTASKGAAASTTVEDEPA